MNVHFQRKAETKPKRAIKSSGRLRWALPVEKGIQLTVEDVASFDQKGVTYEYQIDIDAECVTKILNAALRFHRQLNLAENVSLTDLLAFAQSVSERRDQQSQKSN